jgi:hypothetical protein
LVSSFDASKFSDDFTFSIARNVSSPIPALPRPLLATLGFLNRLPAPILARLHLDPRALFRRLLAFEGSAIVTEAKTLFARLLYSPCYLDVDLLGEHPLLSYAYLDDLPPELLLGFCPLR